MLFLPYGLIMAEETTTTTEETGTASKDLILDLNFVPDWARKPPEKNFFDDARGEAVERPDRRRDFHGGRPDSRDRQQRRPKPDRRREESQSPERQRRPVREPREWVEIPPVHVRFLPHHKYLSEVIRRIKLSRRAHPLMQVAGLFVSNPASCEVRVEVDYDAADVVLFQCKVCGMIELGDDALLTHMMHKHLEDFFIKEEKEVPAPDGKFSCVLQCGLSGVLIGPPNHHSTAEKIRKIRTTQYPGMTEEEYKSRLKTFHEPEKIEQWKEVSRKIITYRLKTAAEGDKTMDWAEAEAYLRSAIAPSQQVKTRRASMSGRVARDIQDRGLAMAVRDAWQQESRFPSSLVGALRGAFHNKDLRLFKAGKGAIFVSDIQPTPLDPAVAIPSIRDVLLYLSDHPGCTRQNLVDALRPGSMPDSKEATEILSPLTWLIERGHIIEFFDGTLAVIGGGRPRSQPKPAKSENPANPAEIAPEQKPVEGPK